MRNILEFNENMNYASILMEVEVILKKLKLNEYNEDNKKLVNFISDYILYDGVGELVTKFFEDMYFNGKIDFAENITSREDYLILFRLFNNLLYKTDYLYRLDGYYKKQSQVFAQKLSEYRCLVLEKIASGEYLNVALLIDIFDLRNKTLGYTYNKYYQLMDPLYYIFQEWMFNKNDVAMLIYENYFKEDYQDYQNIGKDLDLKYTVQCKEYKDTKGR